jgi:heterodisulfide reductase subunit A
MVPDWKPDGACAVATAQDAFIHCPARKAAPTRTSLPGVFVAGVASGPKDIVDTIAEAGAAAMEASSFLHHLAGRHAA